MVLSSISNNGVEGDRNEILISLKKEELQSKTDSDIIGKCSEF